MREHVADTDNRQWCGGTADEADSVSNEAGELEAGKKNNHAEQYCYNIGIRDDASNELGRDFVLEKPDAVGKEGDIEGDNEATICDDAGGTEGVYDDGVAEKGGIIKNQGELRLIAETTFEPIFVKDDFRQNNQQKHDENSADEAGEEEI